MASIADNQVFYCLGLHRNERLQALLQPASSFPMQEIYTQCLNRLKRIHWQAG